MTAKILGRSKAMTDLRARIERMSRTQFGVLILGENGTGKELIAEALHTGSSRADKPFVLLNCAAVPSELIESELFGHEKGAFTGAVERRKGRFEQADGGTLFLDEVGDMPLAMQAKLLRVLEEGTFERVGGRQTLKVDVRILAATNRHLPSEVTQGRFRRDLYHRIACLVVWNPPLRNRLEDVPMLVQAFLARSARPELRLSQTAEAELMTYTYPGNVRELANIADRLVAFTDGDEIGPEDVRAAFALEDALTFATPMVAPSSVEGEVEALRQQVQLLTEMMCQGQERARMTRELSAQSRELAATSRALARRPGRSLGTSQTPVDFSEEHTQEVTMTSIMQTDEVAFESIQPTADAYAVGDLLTSRAGQRGAFVELEEDTDTVVVLICNAVSSLPSNEVARWSRTDVKERKSAAPLDMSGETTVRDLRVVRRMRDAG